MANKKTKRKDYSMASIRRRLSAAVLMLLISVAVLVTSTYAWFTLSTAPEVRGIDTSVAGNGSLEIALMPADGLFSSIGTGRNASGDFAGGTQPVTTANNNWGNIVNLKNAAYGLDLITLKPARINLGEHEVPTGEYYEKTVTQSNPNYDPSNPDSGIPETIEVTVYTETDGVTPLEDQSQPIQKTAIETDPTTFASGSYFSVPEFGYDGRIKNLIGTSLLSHYTSADYTSLDANGFAGEFSGVRAIVDEENDAYGYAIDLAFRLNSTDEDGTPGKLLLQTEGIQRVYSGSSSDATQGGGSNLWFQTKTGEDVTGVEQAQATEYLKAIRIAFVQNLGNKADGASVSILAYARPNVNNGDLYLCDYEGNALTGDDANVIIGSMAKNVAYQITAIVWLDGDAVTNANMAVTNDVLNQATLNLQFSTNVELIPAKNTELENFEAVPTTEAETTEAEPQEPQEP